MTSKLERMKELREASQQGGGPARVEAQHSKGKLTARERLDLLLDEGSFVELDRYVTHRTDDFGMGDKKILGDGVITGHGTVDGRTVFVYSQDFTVLAALLGRLMRPRFCKIMDMAMNVGAPRHRSQ